VASLVYLTTRSDAKLAEELTLAGHRVFNATAVSEALYLCERGHIDAIVIGADIEDPDFAEAQLRYFTIRMKPEESAKDLVWELSKLFPGKPATIH